VPIIGFFAALALPLVCFQLPSICCQRLRAVRFLPIAGMCYYGALVLAAAWFGFAWWDVCLFAIFALLLGDWLPPNPIAFFFSPAKRRAAIAAIEYFETQDGARPFYRAKIIGIEPDRIVVAIELDNHSIPFRCRYVAVRTDGRVEVLKFDDVEAACDIAPMY
jgi:hypothetical protein